MFVVDIMVRRALVRVFFVVRSICFIRWVVETDL